MFRSPPTTCRFESRARQSAARTSSKLPLNKVSTAVRYSPPSEELFYRRLARTWRRGGFGAGTISGAQLLINENSELRITPLEGWWGSSAVSTPRNKTRRQKVKRLITSYRFPVTRD